MDNVVIQRCLYIGKLPGKNDEKLLEELVRGMRS